MPSAVFLIQQDVGIGTSATEYFPDNFACVNVVSRCTGMKMKGLTGLPAKEIDTLLFDLDGTLLDLQLKVKLIFFFQAMTRFKVHFNPIAFSYAFRKSFRHMRANRTECSNYDVFVGKMARFGRTTPQIIHMLLSDLAEKDFRTLSSFFTPVPGAREAVNLAHSLGYRLMLVTNPLMPRQTVLYRMEWAGIRPEDFVFITCSQNMNRCKPSTEFYSRLLLLHDLKPAQCLMIGNNPLDDLPAHDAGIRTFLVETQQSRKQIQKSIADRRLDARGTYQDLINWMNADREKRIAI